LIRLIASVLLLLTVLTGCSTIKPWKAPNHREEGPDSGLFTGKEGEWRLPVGGKSTGSPAGKTNVNQNKNGT
jgi:hypothetical protein